MFKLNHLKYVFSDLLTSISNLDIVLASQPVQKAWSSYVQTVRQTHLDPAQKGQDAYTLFEKAILDLDGHVLKGSILRDLVKDVQVLYLKPGYYIQYIIKMLHI